MLACCACAHPCIAQADAVEAIVNLMGCKRSTAKAILIFYRWDREKVASECSAPRLSAAMHMHREHRHRDLCELLMPWQTRGPSHTMLLLHALR